MRNVIVRRGSNTRLLLCLVLQIALISPALGQTDFDRLYETGQKAFVEDDYFTAYEHLLAYWYVLRYEAQRGGLSVDDNFYFEVVNAANFAKGRIQGRIRQLEKSESDLRSKLAACTGISSKGFFIQPPPSKPPLRPRPPGR
jgi:hypothetical protein